MLKSFHCINISSTDVPKLVTFYRDVLGVPVLFEGYGNYDGVQLGFIKDAPTICIWDENNWGKYEGVVNLVFMTDGLDTTYDELKAKGINLDPPITASWGGRELKLQDLDGNNILLLEPMGE